MRTVKTATATTDVDGKTSALPPDTERTSTAGNHISVSKWAKLVRACPMAH